MIVNDNIKIFMVEFGEPDAARSYSSFGGKSVFVLAYDYNEAGKKALDFVQSEVATKSVLDEIGSLRSEKEINGEVKIKAIKLVTDQLIY